VLEPQKHERHALAAHLVVHLRPIGQRARFCHRARASAGQPGFERLVVQVLGQRPAEPRLPGPPHIVGHGGERHLRGRRDLAPAQALARAEPQDISDLSHGNVGTGHRHLLGASLVGLSEKGAGPHSAHASSDPWNLVISGPYNYENHLGYGGALAFDTSWSNGAPEIPVDDAGYYNGKVVSSTSYAILDNGGICFSGGPSDTVYVS
jgi:hypothetical protein